jgi:hypothetical protein
MGSPILLFSCWSSAAITTNRKLGQKFLIWLIFCSPLVENSTHYTLHGVLWESLIRLFAHLTCPRAGSLGFCYTAKLCLLHMRCRVLLWRRGKVGFLLLFETFFILLHPFHSFVPYPNRFLDLVQLGFLWDEVFHPEPFYQAVKIVRLWDAALLFVPVSINCKAKEASRRQSTDLELFLRVIGMAIRAKEGV